ncbi:MAG: transposase [Bacillus sp. (in: Bacteria)]|nr:transposase [Bacillus sp. (in: firmicutes)]
MYHIILRGANRQEIFHEDEDCLRFLETLEKYKKQTGIKIYGWCLMGNHIHLLLGEGNEEISVTMKRIGVSYARYYNWKYNTVGHLFQDRFKSEGVDCDAYLMTVIRYIHQNPVNAGLVKRPADWRWSSCIGYYGGETYPPGLLDSELILGMFSGEKTSSIVGFRAFNEAENEDKCLENETTKRLTDDQARAEIKKIISVTEMAQIKSFPKHQRDEILSKVKNIEGLTQRQAARILGISSNLIFKA